MVYALQGGPNTGGESQIHYKFDLQCLGLNQFNILIGSFRGVLRLLIR